MLNRYLKLSPNSPEFTKLEYSLQLSLGSVAPAVRNVWAISSGYNAYNYEKKNQVFLK